MCSGDNQAAGSGGCRARTDDGAGPDGGAVEGASDSAEGDNANGPVEPGVAKAPDGTAEASGSKEKKDVPADAEPTVQVLMRQAVDELKETLERQKRESYETLEQLKKESQA